MKSNNMKHICTALKHASFQYYSNITYLFRHHDCNKKVLTFQNLNIDSIVLFD